MHKLLNGSLAFLATFSAVVFLSFLVSCKSFLVFADPPANGDWVITGAESHSDKVIVLNGNLIVEEGGKLTFRRVTLKFNCTYNGQYNITVMPGGEFYVLEDSTITVIDPDKRIGFLRVRYGSTFRMNNSELHDCGSEELTLSGLMIDSSNAIVENSLFSRNMWGILISEDGVIIRKNNITANNCGIEVHAGANPVICDNYISLNNWGMTTGDGSPTVYTNTISFNNGTGLAVEGGSPTINNNTITSNLGFGINGFFSIGSTISDNIIVENLIEGICCHSYSSPTIANNTITSNAAGITCHNHSDPIIKGNTIENNTRGIFCLENSNPTIVANTITSSIEEGLWITNSSPTICNNTISLNNGTGLAVEGGSPTINNNTITSNLGNGIGLWNGADPIIRDNIINLNKYAGIFGDVDCSPIIQDNNVTSNLGQGIVLRNESYSIIQGNIIASNKGDGIVSALNCSSIIEGNNITSNGIAGIVLHNHCVGIIQGNIITSNMDVGIYCGNGSLPEIHWNDIYGNGIGMVGVENADPSVTVNATYNYWGKSPSTSPYVLYDPWLTESVFCAEITTPLSGEIVSSTVTVSTKVDVRSGVQKVEFYIDDQLAHTDYNASYEWNWNTTQYTETEHKIAVRAYYMFGFISSSITVFVDNTRPTVLIKEPTSGDISYGVISVSVNATDNNEIDVVHVEIGDAGLSVMTFNYTDLLWKYHLNTTTFSDGQYTLMVLALDKAGTPATTSITILIDNTPPTLTIQTPQGGAVVGLTLIVDVQAMDTSGISRIEFYLQDVLVYTATDAPCQWSWDTTEHPNGEYAITVKAYDIIGRIQTRETTVTVQNAESPWWQTHFWTIIQVLVAIGALVLGIITYITKKKQEKKEPLKAKKD